MRLSYHYYKKKAGLNMSDVAFPLPKEANKVGNQSLYESPRIQECEQQREQRAVKRKTRLNALKVIRAKKGQ